jgi:hypothetical protein
MKLGRRYGLSTAEKTEIWRRRKAGESLHEIGRARGKDHGSIHFLLSQHGGIVPAVRRRSQRTLTLAEREEISRGIACGSSIRGIARNLQRAASTVSREVARHGGRPRNRASKADHQPWKSPFPPRDPQGAWGLFNYAIGVYPSFALKSSSKLPINKPTQSVMGLGGCVGIRAAGAIFCPPEPPQDRS